MDRRLIAREWLMFLGALAVGATVVPVALKLALADYVMLERFYGSLLDGSLAAWMFVLAPYLILQLVRSIKWALNMVRVTKQ